MGSYRVKGFDQWQLVDVVFRNSDQPADDHHRRIGLSRSPN
jgi:hypothetical protein